MSHSPAVLAFDLGASSGRALVGEWIEQPDQSKKLNVVEVHRFKNGPVHVGKHLHWDILYILQEMKVGIQKAFQQGYSPQSFGIDTWGVDFGLLDKNGELLGNPYHYRDPQTDGMIEEVFSLIEEEKLFAESGLQIMPFNTIFQLYAMKKAGSVKLEEAATFLLTPDLLNYFLTGEKRCEFTMATTTQLVHPEHKKWNIPLMEKLGLRPDMFLEPIHPGTEVGELTDDICAELQVPTMKCFAVGSHDTESAVVAVPAETSNFAYLVCGTWSLLGSELSEALLSPEVRELQFSNEGGVGDTYQLLKNIMGLWIVQECKRIWEYDDPDLTFSTLVEEATQAEPFRSFIDPDDLRFLNPQNMEQEIRDFCAETKQPSPRNRGETVRCILESLALRYRHSLEQLEKLTATSYPALHLVGGGLQNRLLCQFTANAIQRPVIAGPIEASAIGNILVQMQAMGDIKSIEEARAIVRDSFPVETYEARDADVWDQAYKRYRSIANSI